MEDKQKILDALLQTLRLTRSLYDLEELTYEPQSETVFAKYESGYGNDQGRDERPVLGR